MRQFQATTRSARAISSFRQGSARNAVELRSIHTAKIRNQKKRTKWGRSFGATPFRLQNVISISGGRGEIRTPGEVSPTHAFQACPLDHSGTLPL